MKTEFQIVAERIRRIVRGSKKGAMLEAKVLALRLDDPEGPLCQSAGTDDTGRSRCKLCALSDGIAAGCMKYIGPVQAALAQRNSVRVKIKLEALAERLDQANEEGALLQHQKPATHD